MSFLQTLGYKAENQANKVTDLSTNDNVHYPTTAAVQTAINNYVSGLLEFKGSQDCSADPDYPAASKGDAYYVSAAGKIGGAGGVSVEIGDVFIASADNAGGSQASVGASWFVLEHNLVGAEVTSNKDTDGTMAANSDVKYPSQKAAKTYIDNASSNASVIGKLLTGFSAGAGTVSASDTILQAFNKVVGNIGNKQDADADLTAIAGLSPVDNDIIQRKSGAWTNRTPTQFAADINLVPPSNTITLVAASPYTLTVPASMTVAGRNVTNTFTGAQTINVNSAAALLVEQDGVKDNVLVVDTANGMVGVNKAPTLGALDITGGVFSTAQNKIDGTSDQIQLIVQGHSTQTANLQEWQNNSATVLASVNGTGNWGFGTTPASANRIKTLFSNTYDGTVAYSTWNMAHTNTFSVDQVGNLYGIDITYTTANGVYKANKFNAALIFRSIITGSEATAANSAQGVCGAARNTGSGTVTNLVDFYSDVVVNSGGGTVVNSKGYYVSNKGGTGVTNSYAIDIASQSGATNSYAISTGTGLNQFGDQIKIDGSADRIQLIVQAHSTQTTNLQEWQNSSGTVQLAIAGNGRDFILDATTGSKIGTATSQKLGFWNAAPIVQPTTGVTAATIVGGAGTTVKEDHTFDGYTIAQVVKALRNTGLLA